MWDSVEDQGPLCNTAARDMLSVYPHNAAPTLTGWVLTAVAFNHINSCTSCPVIPLLAQFLSLCPVVPTICCHTLSRGLA